MATLIHRVFENFIWRIESLTPTATAGNLRTRFLDYDPLRHDPSAMPTSRNFSVTWASSASDESPTDLYDRVAEHVFELEFHYEPTMKWNTLHEVILQDRHDINSLLRDPAYFIGYSAINSTDEINLKNRIRTGDSLVRSPSLITLRQSWRCMVWETE